MTAARPTRSVLYIPGSKERALEKATGLACDAIIFDLEDAVAVDEKVNARAILIKALREADFGARMRIVRINGQDSDWGRDDALAHLRDARFVAHDDCAWLGIEWLPRPGGQRFMPARRRGAVPAF